MGWIIIIKLLVCDVDGTLTDGMITYGNSTEEFKTFSIKDGLILKMLPTLNIDVVLLTGRTSEAVERRAAELGIIAIQGIQNKLPVLRNLLAKHNIETEQCAYIGDDLNDYAAMEYCGFKACPVDAAMEIRELCDYVSQYRGGHGAVRDICEKILNEEGKYDDLLALYAARKLSS